MGLDFRRVFAVGLVFLGIQAAWTTYNAYVPGFMTGRFGLSAAFVAGFLLFEKIVTFAIEPTVGILSDDTHVRLGARLPYILVGIPLTALAFALIPLPIRLIPPGELKQLAALQGLVNPFLIFAVFSLVAMSLIRVPAVTIIPDITPSELRGQANGILQFMGGVGVLLATYLGRWLVQFDISAPFWAAIAILLVAGIVLLRAARPSSEEVREEEEEIAREGDTPRLSWRNLPSLVALLLAIATSFLALAMLGSFLPTYGQQVLRLDADTAAFLPTLFTATYLLCTLIAAFASERLGRRTAILGGLLGVAVCLALTRLGGGPVVTTALVVAAGAGWSLVLVNTLPLVLDLGPTRFSGTYTGLYFLAFALAGILGSEITPVIVAQTTANVGLRFLVVSAILVVSAALMLGVHYGDTQPATQR